MTNNQAIAIDRDIQDARALLADATSKDDGPKYRKAAEIILLKILHHAPDHSEARALLTSIKSVPTVLDAQSEVSPPPAPVAAPIHPSHSAAAVTREPEIAFSAHSVRPSPKNVGSTSGMVRKLSVALIAIGLAGAGMFAFRSAGSSELPGYEPAETTSSSAVSETPSFDATAMPDSSLQTSVALPPSNAIAENAEAAPIQDTTTVVAAPPAPVKLASIPVPAAQPGLLAVSSPTPADIFDDEKYLGSTPITLQLPAGPHTLEYRHGSFRSVATHQIRPNETTTAMVTFDVTLQINARPWAQVFVEGSTRRPLGQTPLSSVRVPIGSVLVFENPDFASKTRRVSENDSAIQVNFP